MWLVSALATEPQYLFDSNIEHFAFSASEILATTKFFVEYYMQWIQQSFNRFVSCVEIIISQCDCACSAVYLDARLTWATRADILTFEPHSLIDFGQHTITPVYKSQHSIARTKYNSELTLCHYIRTYVEHICLKPVVNAAEVISVSHEMGF